MATIVAVYFDLISRLATSEELNELNAFIVLEEALERCLNNIHSVLFLIISKLCGDMKKSIGD